MGLLALGEVTHQQKNLGPHLSKQVSSHQGNRAGGQVQEFVLYLMAPQSALLKTAKRPAGLGACGSGRLCPDDGSFFPDKGTISWVTTECSAPVSTVKSTGWPPT